MSNAEEIRHGLHRHVVACGERSQCNVAKFDCTPGASFRKVYQTTLKCAIAIGHKDITPKTGAVLKQPGAINRNKPRIVTCRKQTLPAPSACESSRVQVTA